MTNGHGSKIHFDGSATGGDAKAHYGHWNSKGPNAPRSEVVAGDGLAGDVSIGRTHISDGDFHATGKGGSATGNAGGNARGGTGKGGNFTIN
ncbi:hypothetical protein S7711_11260 [Stachybotrys chartarum IBT 7711]|jgi:hypothetical protein|uniref:Uncharacterized protein n=1 Tax=Stachybotrys chartarum (strain CBS 109288 / IBT 7711) TaxID=1280523 RepID=A0A084AGG7_STACB|nr:hypothetical protein S7711_11260 [Stachybotrys chartarum IBT 7711]KFA52578.1 hypothetical protein S40293_11200 [Stachybotrys chartarum IBT 40293]KFA71801.1 hypothetical protein S40288_11261 [Stachybotrys chartarum IBT 40288]